GRTIAGAGSGAPGGLLPGGRTIAAAADVVPAAAARAAPLLPAIVALLLDVAVAAGVDIVALLAHEAAVLAVLPAGRGTAFAALRLPLGVAIPVGRALGIHPVVAALDGGRAPAAVHIPALTGGDAVAGARVVRRRIARGAARAVRHAGARIRSGRGVVGRGPPHATVRTIRRLVAAVGAGPRVVGDTATIGHRARVVDRIAHPRIVVVGRIVEPGAPHGAAEG